MAVWPKVQTGSAREGGALAARTRSFQIGDGDAVCVDGATLPYRVRRSSRARHAALHIHPRLGLEVVLPSSAPAGAERDLLAEKAAWLRRHALLLRRASRARVELRSGATVPYRGEWLEVVLRRGESGVRRVGRRLVVALSDPADEDAARRALETWFRREARSVLLDRVGALRAPGDGRVRRIAVRDQDTRWGSCSSAGTLSFNWRLIMAPPDVLDAVVVHELVHLRIADHSAAFWRALDARFPRHRACRRWLDANAYRLGF